MMISARAIHEISATFFSALLGLGLIFSQVSPAHAERSSLPSFSPPHPTDSVAIGHVVGAITLHPPPSAVAASPLPPISSGTAHWYSADPASTALAGGGRVGNSPVPPSPDLGIVQIAREDLAVRTGLPLSAIGLLQITSVIWPDTSLGHPRIGAAYAQTVTPGYDILLQAAGQEYVYHSDTGRLVVYCPKP